MSHLYIHIPFCAHRCGYCDFVSSTDHNRIPAYISALCTELGLLKAHILKVHPQSLPLKTIYIGGGTPSFLPVHEMGRLLSALRTHFGHPTHEFTVEMNPESTHSENVKLLADYGVSRISMGMQAAQPQILQLLERHTHMDQVANAVNCIKNNGIGHLSLDLIYGIPTLNLQQIQESLDAMLLLEPDHISAYALKLETGTALSSKEQQGKMTMPDDDTVAEQLEFIVAYLENKGFDHYEISNFALLQPKDTEVQANNRSPRNNRSQHNLAYWDGSITWGAGLGAVYLGPCQEPYKPKDPGNLDDPINRGSLCRYENTTDFSTYISRIEEGLLPYISFDQLTMDDLAFEAMILGLRVKEGINLTQFKERFGYDFYTRHKKAIDQMVQMGFMCYSRTHVSLTQRGMAVENAVILKLWES